jgi:hypothetical protein
MRPAQRRRLAVDPSLFVFGALSFCSTRAWAYEARVSAQHEAQFYGVQSPFGSPAVLRRRHTSALGLELYDLAGESERGPRLEFKARLRLDADFGQLHGERDPSSDRFVPGLEQAPLDVLYAYFDAEALCSGTLGLRVGRQLIVDALGFFTFDGARLRLDLPLGLELGGYAGLEPRPGLPLLATSRYLGDGVQRGNRDGLEANSEPSFLDESRLSPAIGAWFAARGIGPLSASVAYRRVVNRSRVRLSPFAATPSEPPESYGDARIGSERVGSTARLDWPEVGSLSGLALYDLYLRTWNELGIALDTLPARSLRAGAELSHSRPSFDADSIFNWFPQGATGRALVHLTYFPWRPLETSFNWGVRWFETNGDPERNLTAALTGRLRLSPNEFALAAVGEAGDRGRLSGADLSWRSRLAGGRYDSLVLLSMYDWSDPLRPQRDATSFSYVLGAGLLSGSGLFSETRLGLEWEHTVNRLVSQRFRVLATLELGVFR